MKNKLETPLGKCIRKNKEESRENPADMFEYREPDVQFNDEPLSWNDNQEKVSLDIKLV